MLLEVGSRFLLMQTLYYYSYEYLLQLDAYAVFYLVVILTTTLAVYWRLVEIAEMGEKDPVLHRLTKMDYSSYN
jgi:hypothetical protein